MGNHQRVQNPATLLASAYRIGESASSSNRPMDEHAPQADRREGQLAYNSGSVVHQPTFRSDHCSAYA
jgi:hypothetical protein